MLHFVAITNIRVSMSGKMSTIDYALLRGYP